MNNKEQHFKKTYHGLSNDRRTNKWLLTCPCGKSWNPTTTLFAIRSETCPRCEKTETVNYNE